MRLFKMPSTYSKDGSLRSTSPRRVAWKLALLLVIGTMINVLIAWSIVIWRGPINDMAAAAFSMHGKQRSVTNWENQWYRMTDEALSGQVNAYILSQGWRQEPLRAIDRCGIGWQET